MQTYHTAHPILHLSKLLPALPFIPKFLRQRSSLTNLLAIRSPIRQAKSRVPPPPQGVSEMSDES